MTEYRTGALVWVHPDGICRHEHNVCGAKLGRYRRATRDSSGKREYVISIGQHEYYYEPDRVERAWVSS